MHDPHISCVPGNMQGFLTNFCYRLCCRLKDAVLNAALPHLPAMFPIFLYPLVCILLQYLIDLGKVDQLRVQHEATTRQDPPAPKRSRQSMDTRSNFDISSMDEVSSWDAAVIDAPDCFKDLMTGGLPSRKRAVPCAESCTSQCSVDEGTLRLAQSLHDSLVMFREVGTLQLLPTVVSCSHDLVNAGFDKGNAVYL